MTEEDQREDEAGAATTEEPAKKAAEAEATPASDTHERGEGDEPESDSEEGGDDDGAATPEAIARRVAALGEDDEIERLAREEERKLAERRAQKKGKKKKGGLEAAASKKLAKIGTRAEPRRSVATAADADPLIERTAKLSEWAKKNQRLVQVLGGAIAIALLGLAGYLYYDNKRETEASVMLSKAVEAERAPIGEPPKSEDDDAEPPLMFKTYDARTDAALAKYREVESRFPKTGAAILARLAEGSLLLDKKDPDGALAAFQDVKSSPLAAADQEVKGRSIEGIGMAYEQKALAGGEGGKKFLDDALQAYKELENTVDVKGFKELAMYDQARVLQNKGDKDKAKEILVSLRERLDKPDENVANIPQGPAFPYLQEVARDRLHEIDPAAAPRTGHAPGGSPQLTPAQIRKMIEDAQKKQQQQGHGDQH